MSSLARWLLFLEKDLATSGAQSCDAIFIDVPDTGGGSTDKLVSGKYVIAILKHAIRAGKGVTKLGLVRDSFGRKGKPHSGSMVN